MVRFSISSIGGLSCKDDVPLIDFISSCLHILGDGELNLLCVIWWRIWYVRNRWVHSGERINLGAMASWCSIYLAEYKAANLEDVEKQGMVITSPVRWRLPIVGLYKLNTDTSLDSSSQWIGLGMVIRDQDGNVMASSTQRVEANFSPKVADALTILWGFTFAIDTGLLLVYVESDTIEVVNLVKKFQLRLVCILGTLESFCFVMLVV
ncbi:hypothetical protein LWI29_005679 [Acer saccharum]|uniref:RNase H type-1 domain-containing protein n=1 Tax=Acer saccharum TaxID=4024 RepID=A0AA39TP61_ACESA|nr:hypothetical protein LWI29_005679 [Acer saccharum]